MGIRINIQLTGPLGLRAITIRKTMITSTPQKTTLPAVLILSTIGRSTS